MNEMGQGESMGADFVTGKKGIHMASAFYSFKIDLLILI